MCKVALFARLEAKPGKENEVAKFLEAGLAKAPELFAKAPAIEPLEVLGAKQVAQYGHRVWT